MRRPRPAPARRPTSTAARKSRRTAPPGGSAPAAPEDGHASAERELEAQREALRLAHQQLARKAFELHNLFDLSRELVGGSPEEAVCRLAVTTVMGHFLVARCALYLRGPRGLTLVEGRGLRREGAPALIPLDAAEGGLDALAGPWPVAELPAGPLRQRLEQARLVLALPFAAGAGVGGLLAIGERSSGSPFSPEERELAATLARQTASALENARLSQDRELELAREIQRGLFPSQPPQLHGFELAGASQPCYEVGGDAYDWIPLRDGRLAFLVADVAGKGTPASLLMASVQAFVHALAGTATPALVVGQLNRFLVARTQASKFVTLFYAELEPAARRLVYVNAGHVPPYRIAARGRLERLAEGGPAAGLLPDASYASGEATLEAGDVVAVVTDGVTESATSDEREFGDAGVVDTLRRFSGEGAGVVLEGLVAAAEAWAKGMSAADDRTALILKAV
jgi:serine phosphatase RsbU (regulator of sigma subunit)